MYLTFLIGIAAAVIIFFIVVMAVDGNRFLVREYSCGSKKQQEMCRIVLLSDLHNHSYGKDNKRLLDAIRKQRPDLILAAGDLYTAAKGGDTQCAIQLLKALSESYPVYCINGNHEQKTRLYPETFGNMYEQYAKAVQGAGVRLLTNEKVSLPQWNIDIYGLELDKKFYGKLKRTAMQEGYLGRMLGKPDASRYNILIAHNPDYFKNYAQWGADLVVSGHVHGGLMRLPLLGGVISPALRLFPKYDGGQFREGKSVMVLSRGLGMHTLPIRIFNPGELVVICLVKE